GAHESLPSQAAQRSRHGRDRPTGAGHGCCGRGAVPRDRHGVEHRVGVLARLRLGRGAHRLLRADREPAGPRPRPIGPGTVLRRPVHRALRGARLVRLGDERPRDRPRARGPRAREHPAALRGPRHQRRGPGAPRVPPGQPGAGAGLRARGRPGHPDRGGGRRARQLGPRRLRRHGHRGRPAPLGGPLPGPGDPRRGTGQEARL
ncbi:MAG: hypothetical protein AVDCRST_MAG47-1643, partial [uncultured Nocardioidaceae bacterium]